MTEISLSVGVRQICFTLGNLLGIIVFARTCHHETSEEKEGRNDLNVESDHVVESKKKGRPDWKEARKSKTISTVMMTEREYGEDKENFYEGESENIYISLDRY